MDRFFLPRAQWQPEAVLTGEEAHHCARVMRKQVGDRIVVFDGEGTQALAEIISVAKERVGLSLAESQSRPSLSPKIELAVGVPKGKTMDLIVQKAVELGVHRIQPLSSEQGTVKIAAEAKKEDKWQRVALEACKQCGQNYLPEVAPTCTVESYLSALEPGGLSLIAALHPRAVSLKTALAGQRPELVRIMVGPEGDFSAAEYEAAFRAGVQSVGLGELVLRVETAVLYLISSIRYEASED